MTRTTTTRPRPIADPARAPISVVGRLRGWWARAWPTAIAGALAAGVAIAVTELLAGVIPGAPSLVTAIGTLVISLQPPGAKDVVVSLFGTNDKVALNLGIVIAALAVATAAGVLAGRRFWLGASVFVAFGVVALIAGVGQPLASPPFAVANAVLAVVTGLITLWALLRLGPHARVGDASSARSAAGAAMPDWDRRRLLIASAGTLGSVVVVGQFGRMLVEAGHPTGIVSTSRLPATLDGVPPLTADQTLPMPGVTPLVMPSDEFYRIDTALLVPRVDVATWQLEVSGMVDRPLTFSYDDLLAMPLFEQYVTIACVSNRVGEGLVGNALWTGVRLKEVLAMVGVQAGATQIVGRSVDGFTVGFPTSWAMAPEREPMIAVGMNRDLLPADHGYPARLIIPGLYGYVSATKWLSSIELTTREAVDGYWVPLGWAKDAPILTQSRIDTPGSGDALPVGPVDIAGVAWAPDRGISAVQVRVDDGPWQEATVSRPISKATWVQWRLPWTAGAGRHSIEVQAIDGTGAVQTAERTDPAPDGARGHHRIFVTAT